MSQVQDRPITALVDQIASISPTQPWQPTSEVIRTTRGATYFFDLPGVLPRNLHLACRDGRLLVWGHRAAIPAPNASLEHSSTRPSGPFAAEAAIHDSFDPSRIAKEFKDGVLTVFIPKRRESLKRS